MIDFIINIMGVMGLVIIISTPIVLMVFLGGVKSKNNNKKLLAQNLKMHRPSLLIQVILVALFRLIGFFVVFIINKVIMIGWAKKRS